MKSEKINPGEFQARQDYDTPWKKMLEAYFREFIEFFFPEIAKD